MNTKKVFVVSESGVTWNEYKTRIAEHPALEQFFISWWVSWKKATHTIKKHIIDTVDIIICNTPRKTGIDIMRELVNIAPEKIIYDSAWAYKHNKQWQYALPEIAQSNLFDKKLLAWPGCFATWSILALKPLVTSGILDQESDIYINGVSGYSTWGKKWIKEFETKNANFIIPNSSNTHPHIAEIKSKLSIQSSINFIPKLINTYRGMYLEIHWKLNSPQANLEDIYSSVYKDAPLINYSKDIPLLQDAQNTDLVIINGYTYQKDFVLFVALDNLGKWSIWQTIQTLNNVLDIPEQTWLRW